MPKRSRDYNTEEIGEGRVAFKIGEERQFVIHYSDSDEDIIEKRQSIKEWEATS